MSFAATDYSITLKDVRQIYITNHTKKDLKGFKLYYYFNSQPVKDLKELKEKKYALCGKYFDVWKICF
jgi:hypothetical protein